MYISVIIAQTTGLFCFILSIFMLSCSKRFTDVSNNLEVDSPGLFFINVLTLLGACFLLVIHNNWETQYHVAISVVGWLLFAKSILWIIIPDEMIKFAKISTSPKNFTLVSLLTMLIGVFFLVCGFGPIWHLS